ncbi:hypothetical protein [Saccharopolyspora taberi]|uniref:WXG100 family type VII secretion target n=1 Tax=Saccharopolyspora taberi TaxID=60895 RepID=A0ABN3V7E6_9PSEU
MNGFRGDPEQLAKRAAEFEEHAGRAQRISADLRGAVDSAGECWGRDAIGASFAATHQERARRTADELAAMGGRLRDLGAKFGGAAAEYRQVDAGQAEELGRTTGQG